MGWSRNSLKRRANSNQNAKSPLGLNTPRRSASPFVINSLNSVSYETTQFEVELRKRYTARSG